MASTKPDYQFEHNFNHPYLNTEVDAVAPAPFLRLTKTKDQNTKPEQNSTGRFLCSDAVQFGSSTSFQTTVKFTITPTDTLPPGDGLAFFIVPEGHEFPAPAGGNLGIFGPGEINAGVFAVALDFGIQKDFIILGIDIESRVPKHQIRVPHDFVGKQLTLFVSYDAQSGEIIASLASSEEELPAVKCKSKLTDFLPNKVSLGLASSTSKAAAIHDVNYWAFFIDGQ